MSLQISGKLKVKKDEEIVSEKFKKREFVITDESSQYPQFISFQLTQAKCSLLDNFQVGDNIRVHFNLRGREWNSPTGEVKYFNSLEAWKIEGEGSSTGSSSHASVPAGAPFVQDSGMDASEDLPF